MAFRAIPPQMEPSTVMPNEDLPNPDARTERIPSSNPRPKDDTRPTASDTFAPGRESTLAEGVTNRSDQETFAAGSDSSGLPGDGSTGGGSRTGERYQVVRLHARGGIGQVLLAIDSDLSREVALKEIQPALSNDEASRRRFLLEAEITGRLEHPGVVPVYSLGKSPDDRPFYVMRFIRGESLKEAIDRFHADMDRAGKAAKYRSLEFRQLLRRFVDVCNTIAYAHSRGILHRDLKPSNVMLGPYGETLVVDWGLAKVVGRHEPEFTGEATLRPQTGSGSSETLAGMAIGTPAFMSPEQAEGKIDSIGPASDIYSLGATLFAILTGKPPFTETSLDRLLARVRSGDFLPPRGLEPAVPRALDAICSKAMAHTPANRYATASRLAQEIDHWLADEPVDCHREPALARLSRWGRHHKTGVAAAGIFLVMTTLMLTAGTIALTQVNARIDEERRLADAQRVIAQKQRDLARENFDKAREAVNSYLAFVTDEPLLNKPGLEPVRQKLLRSALPYYEDFIRQRGDDPTLRLELAEAYRLTGEITGQIDSRAQARERLERAVRLYEEILTVEGDALPPSVGLARALVSLSYFEVFDDDHAKAEKTTDRAIEHLERLTKEQPGSPEFGRLLGRSYDLKSINHSLTGDYTASLKISDKAVARLEATVKAFPDDLQTKRILARSLNNRAAALLLIGKLDESLKAFERSAARLKNLLAAEPEEAISTVILARVLTNMARVHITSGHYALSLRPAEEARAFVDKLLSGSPDMNEYLGLAADLDDRIALALAKSGRTGKAREMVRSCLSHEKAMTAKGALNDDLRETFADAWWTLMLIEARDGHEAEAENAFAKADAYFVKMTEGNTDDNFASQRSCMQEDRIRYRPATSDSKALDAKIAQLKAIVDDRTARLTSGTDPETRRTELASVLVTLSESLFERDRIKFDLAPLKQALESIDQVLEKRPESLEIRGIQVRALTILARHQAAKSDGNAAISTIDRAVDIATRAAAEDPAYLYDLACAHAAASSILPESDKARTERHRKQALATIRKAVESGFDDFARLRIDPDLAAIRDLPEFQEFRN